MGYTKDMKGVRRGPLQNVPPKPVDIKQPLQARAGRKSLLTERNM